MEFFLGGHALDQMDERGITEEMVEAVLDDPTFIEHSRDLVFKYYGEAGGLPIAVVIAFDMNPPFVVTVMFDTAAREG